MNLATPAMRSSSCDSRLRVARSADGFLPSCQRFATPSMPSEDQTSIFVRTRPMTSSVNSVVPAWPPRSGVRTPARRRLEHGLVDRARGALGAGAAALGGVVQDRAAGQDHRHRVGDVLALQRRRGAVRRLGHRDRRA